MSRKKPQTKDAPELVSTRRSFFRKACLGLGGVAVVEAFVIVIDFLRPRRSRSEGKAADIIEAGPVERFEPRSVTAFPRGKFYLARLQDGGFLALSRECTHLGCTVPWAAEENRFICPCHSSAFDIRGDVLSPPASRALDLYAVRIENGIVKIDIRKPLERQSFQVAQVTRPMETHER